MTSRELEEFFSEFGPVAYAHVWMEPKTRRSRGYVCVCVLVVTCGPMVTFCGSGFILSQLEVNLQYKLLHLLLVILSNP